MTIHGNDDPDRLSEAGVRLSNAVARLAAVLMHCTVEQVEALAEQVERVRTLAIERAKAQHHPVADAPPTPPQPRPTPRRNGNRASGPA